MQILLIEILSLEEERQLLEQLGETYRNHARLAMLTGLRLGEQFSMKWEWVDFERGCSPFLERRPVECSMSGSMWKPKPSYGIGKPDN